MSRQHLETTFSQRSQLQFNQFKMSQLKSDACVFKSIWTMFIPSYVDHLLIIGQESEVNAFITNISKVFNIKHTTHLSSGTWIHFLGSK
eukprot:2556720-Amphidinium_carterae.1